MQETYILMNSHYEKIQFLEEKIASLEQNILDLRAKVSRLMNPDYPHYTDEELDAMFEAASRVEREFE